MQCRFAMRNFIITMILNKYIGVGKICLHLRVKIWESIVLLKLTG